MHHSVATASRSQSQLVENKDGIRIRVATANDLPVLLELENSSFDHDKLSRRSFRRFLDSETASLQVATVDTTEGEAVAAYVLTLFHKGSNLARIYSIAVDKRFAGRGIASRLLNAAEAVAVERHCIAMRLEVSEDNAAAIALYKKHEYRHFGVLDDYYEDHQPALRYQKLLRVVPQSDLMLNIPYYPQTMDFSCGPASLMMALAFLRDHFQFAVHEELEIWREATTIFMTAGHGGCGPHGLALAAVKRGLRAEVFVNNSGPLFMEGVRREEKKRILKLVHDGFISKIKEFDIPVHERPLKLADIEDALRNGVVPLVLISTYHFDKCKTPHWVTVTALDEDFVYIHDPDVDPLEHQTVLDSQHLPIHRKRFEKMSQFGTKALRAAVLLCRAD
ncbi:GNAT family N-acetyltransferase/peptidase C39 family protein [Allohahella sp. A8]|uniref:GNAT family N-acetyltransferase/peptidase C39 family protein n=1 Tax=Allohahella sp. A8 TaxID=3141461 RepID=UPI000C0AE1F2|nr:ribosomal-protein-alanine acetyltransferase [Hahellaceae bacterium]|tara:strand:- start:15821 stop:16996 length:1176 start_codon:yes stop_codon:yes gene_type:complete